MCAQFKAMQCISGAHFSHLIAFSVSAAKEADQEQNYEDVLRDMPPQNR